MVDSVLYLPRIFYKKLKIVKAPAQLGYFWGGLVVSSSVHLLVHLVCFHKITILIMVFSLQASDFICYMSYLGCFLIIVFVFTPLCGVCIF